MNPSGTVASGNSSEAIISKDKYTKYIKAIRYPKINWDE